MCKDIFSKKDTLKAKGFSLIELMVSLTIFSIVMTVSISTLLVIIDANAKSQALYNTMTDLSFALDTMTRNIRMGSMYHCAAPDSNSIKDYLKGGTGDIINNDCVNGNTAIAFTHNVNGRYGYRLSEGHIEQTVNNSSSDPTWVNITSDGNAGLYVDIKKFEIVVENSGSVLTDSDTDQPQISIIIAGEITNGLDTPTAFRLQSNVTPRILDY